jgi:ribosomal protein S18 acetylase RimI-like enzyme
MGAVEEGVARSPIEEAPTCGAGSETRAVAASSVAGCEVVRAKPADDASLAAVLARAFDDDPLVNWVFRDDEAREEARILYFRTSLELGHPHGMVFTVDSHLGAAIWNAPGQWRVGLWRQLVLVRQILRMLGRRRFARGLSTFDRLQREHPEEPHYYLAVLGVDPTHQSQGIGSALVRAGLELADREGLGAYLETANPRTLPLYERHGFAVTQVIEFAPGSPKSWLMWRNPQ